MPPERWALTRAIPWMNLEMEMRNESTQMRGDPCCRIPLTGNTQN